MTRVRITGTVLGTVWEGELDDLLAANSDLDDEFVTRVQDLQGGETAYFSSEWFSLTVVEEEEKENSFGAKESLTHSTGEGHGVGSLLTLNLPELFELPDFIAYVNKWAGKGLATWHTPPGFRSPLGEHADVFIQADISLQENGWEIECSEEFPETILTLLADTVGTTAGEWHGIIRLTNLQE